MKLVVLTALLLPVAAVAQTDDPAPAASELECTATPGGAECKVEATEEGSLYCLAVDSAGESIANSTVSSDAGVAVFNAVAVEDIAGITCRME